MPLAVLLFPIGAAAQTFGQLLGSEIPLDMTSAAFPGVLDRPRPELQPPPLRLAGMALTASLDTALGTTSNVSGAQSQRRADGFAEWQPQLVTALDSAADRLVQLTLNYDGKRFFDTPAKRQDGHFIGLIVDAGLGGDGSLVLTAYQQRIYEDQLAGTYPQGGGGAVAIDQAHGQARLSQTANRLTWTGALTFDRLGYQATVTTTGVVLPQSYRDDSVLRASSRLDYRVQPATALFAQLTWRDTRYGEASAYADRSSREWRAIAGMSADVTGLIRVSAGIGGYTRRYETARAGPQFGKIAGLAWDLRGGYAVSTLTTLSLQARREYSDANVALSPGYEASSLRLELDHEFLRQLLVSASLADETDRFTVIARQDRLRVLALWGDYWIAPQLLVKPRIELIDRTSHGADAGPRIPEFRTQLTLSVRP